MKSYIINTGAYYGVLAEVGKGRWQPSNDMRPWIRLTLTAHLRQARTVLRRVKEAERLWIELETLLGRQRLPDRTINALFDAAQGLRVRNSTYRASLTDAEEITEQTASRDLGELVGTGLLMAHGKARGRYYVAGPPIRSLRRAVVEARDPRDDRDPFAS